MPRVDKIPFKKHNLKETITITQKSNEKKSDRIDVESLIEADEAKMNHASKSF
jgi:hypothetical protein